jgi:hypothetical protein
MIDPQERERIREVANHNEASREAFTSQLVFLRVMAMSKGDFAEASGWSIEQIDEIEAHWHSWTLREATFYALCLGAKVDFTVTRAES